MIGCDLIELLQQNDIGMRMIGKNIKNNLIQMFFGATPKLVYTVY